LACLGNGELPGNSIGNQIALEALYPTYFVDAAEETKSMQGDVVEALRFLIEVKDRKETDDLYKNGAQYQRDKEKAWADARDALAAFDSAATTGKGGV
jgi:hypothetical protein